MYLHVSEAGSKGSGTSANGEKAGSVSVFLRERERRRGASEKS